MSEAVRTFTLASAILLALASARCVSQSPGVEVELVFEAPPSYDALTSPVTRSEAFIIEVALVPCEEPTYTFWQALSTPVAHAHEGESTPTGWAGARRVNALSVAGDPIALLSPPATEYCAVVVTFAPDEVSEADPREDPMVGRSVGVEGEFLSSEGSTRSFAVRASAHQTEVIPLDTRLVLDDAQDIARVALSFDALAWADSMEFEGVNPGVAAAALSDGLHTHLHAEVTMLIDE